MICQQCGKEIPDDSKFCTFCGAEVQQHQPIESKVTKRHQGKMVNMKMRNVCIALALFAIAFISSIAFNVYLADKVSSLKSEVNNLDNRLFGTNQVVMSLINSKSTINKRLALLEKTSTTSQPSTETTEQEDDSKQIVLEGTLGGEAIVMTLNIKDGNGASGYYQRKGTKGKIILYGKFQYGTLKLEESIPGIDNPGEFVGDLTQSSFTGNYSRSGESYKSFALGIK